MGQRMKKRRKRMKRTRKKRRKKRLCLRMKAINKIHSNKLQ